jgi:hypothetical protein
MPLAVARKRAGRAGLAILALPGSSFLETVQLFYSTSSVNSMLPAALECVGAVQERLCRSLAD